MNSCAAKAIEEGRTSASCRRAVAVMRRSNIEVSGTGPASLHRCRKRVEAFYSALCDIRLGLRELPDERSIGEHCNGFFESFEVVRGHDHR